MQRKDCWSIVLFYELFRPKVKSAEMFVLILLSSGCDGGTRTNIHNWKHVMIHVSTGQLFSLIHSNYRREAAVTHLIWIQFEVEQSSSCSSWRAERQFNKLSDWKTKCQKDQTDPETASNTEVTTLRITDVKEKTSDVLTQWHQKTERNSRDFSLDWMCSSRLRFVFLGRSEIVFMAKSLERK